MLPRRACHSRWVRVDGALSRYWVGGSGAPPLLVASPLVSARVYRPVARALTATFTVTLVDLPGAGGAARLRERWTSVRYAAWLLELVRRLPLAAPVVVAHSASAPCVAELARLAPDELGAVVFANPAGACVPRAPARMILERARDAVDEPLVTLRAAPGALASAARHRRVYAAHLAAALAAELLPVAPSIRTPTLVASGARDRTVPPSCAEALATALPDARLSVGPGSHDWIIAAPGAFSASVRRFVASLARRAGRPRGAGAVSLESA